MKKVFVVVFLVVLALVAFIVGLLLVEKLNNPNIVALQYNRGQCYAQVEGDAVELFWQTDPNSIYGWWGEVQNGPHKGLEVAYDPSQSYAEVYDDSGRSNRLLPVNGTCPNLGG